MSLFTILTALAALVLTILALAAGRPTAKILTSAVAAAAWYGVTVDLAGELQYVAAALTLLFGSLTTAYGIAEALDAWDRRQDRARANPAARPPVIITHRTDLTEVDGRTITVERIPAHVDAAARFGAIPQDTGLLAVVERRDGRFVAIAGTERHHQGEDLNGVAAAYARRRAAVHVPGGPAVHTGPQPTVHVATLGPQFSMHADHTTLQAHAVLAIGMLRIRFSHSETARSWARTLHAMALELDEAREDLAAEQHVETTEAAR